MTPTRPDADSLPWWRHRMMWLVVGGPAVVVVAASITAVIAIRGSDDILDERAASGARGNAVSGPDAPALKARNHAATAGR